MAETPLAAPGAACEPGPQGMPGALEKAKEIIAATPGAIEPGQFVNPANPAVHEATTAEEIWNDTAGKVDALVEVRVLDSADDVGDHLVDRWVVVYECRRETFRRFRNGLP